MAAPHLGDELLERPTIGVGVVEIDEVAPGEVFDRAHRGAAADEFGPGGLDVGNDDLDGRRTHGPHP